MYMSFSSTSGSSLTLASILRGRRKVLRTLTDPTPQYLEKLKPGYLPHLARMSQHNKTKAGWHFGKHTTA